MSTNTARAAFVDITPTWGEWANIYRRLAETGEGAAVKHLAQDFAKAMAACQALNAIRATLTDEQERTVATTLVSELTKQGF